ncbi:DUF2934 domain-containing protein [Sinorhizobium mexicanum]|uniref:DUF2934 domain-containing protein n=1 Tax=Sinorhizobium mexicanum TaxID=375549 RepID=A0A859QYZ5_9HYPH|nr:DUF2934 domain-containing protein [Sinorhizobium mexicanum]MBP1883963.1 hypothetical protein [Sinorhizobium mexicanum]QLL64689.1 DUF2934 domain-containing protein [Sinorhizobium mexicanum]
MKTDGEELIRKRAYELWERAGRPEGDGLKHWLEAAEEIQARIDRRGEPEKATLSGDPIVSADPSEGKKPRKSAARKLQDDAKPKKNPASKARSKKD